MIAPTTTVGAVLLDIVAGKSIQTLERPAAQHEFGILKVSAVTWGEFRAFENKAMPAEYDPGDCPRPMDGDILISRANTRELVGAPVMVQGDYPNLLLSDKLLKLVPDESMVDRRYLLRALRSPAACTHFFKRAGGSSGSMTNITQADIRSAPLPLPALPEQRRIAAILDKADTIRFKRREAMVELDRLVQSVFVELFGDPATNPKGWPVRPLKGLGKVSTGGTPPSAVEGMFGGEIPFITPGDLESNQPVRRRVTEAGAQEAGTVRAGATLVCCIGATIGKTGQATVRSSFNQQLNAVEWFVDEVDDQYGLATLRFFKPTIVAWGASTTLPILKKSSFEKLSIPVPPLHLQQEFARRACAMAQLGEKLRAGLDADLSLFATLQSRAFAGEL